jgi:hypothetical protein
MALPTQPMFTAGGGGSEDNPPRPKGVGVGDRYQAAMMRFVSERHASMVCDSVESRLSMVQINPIRVETEVEDDGRILASVPDLPV